MSVSRRRVGPITRAEYFKIVRALDELMAMLDHVEHLIGGRWLANSGDRWHRIKRALLLLDDDIRNDGRGWL